jgi:hypothetical protein
MMPSNRAYADACSAHIRLSIHPFAAASEVHYNVLSMKRRHQSRLRGFTRRYDGGIHGGWAHLAQGPGIQGRDFWSRRAATRPPLPLRHLHNRLLYRRNTYHLHRCNLRKNTAHTRHTQSVHRLRLPPHMNCSTLPLKSSPLWPWLLLIQPLSAAGQRPQHRGTSQKGRLLLIPHFSLCQELRAEFIN